jgi:4-hydroxybenzoate polyprenyltransferase
VSATDTRSRSKLPGVWPLVKLTRLPSVVTVPGDVLAGAAWASGDPDGASPVALVCSSCMAYLGGMALNDWADREEDARERPNRPIPSGQVAPEVALGISIALTAGSLLVAARAASRGRALAVALPLAAAVWGYDLKAKQTMAGPYTMALARTLDVLVGATRVRDAGALPAAGLIGAHTLLITIVSGRETQGAGPNLAAGALAGVAATTFGGAWLVSRGETTAPRRAAAVASLGLYGWSMGNAGVAALRNGDAPTLQRFVGTGVFANMPLQAALLARRGKLVGAAGLLGAWQVGRRSPAPLRA